MNQHEEELQKNIEAGVKPVGDDPDLQAYQEVFIRLKREPEVHLSPAFAANILARIIEKKKLSNVRDFIWLGTGMFSLFIALIVAIAMSGFKLNFGFLKNMSGYAGLFVFGVVLILVLNHLDKNFILEKGDIHPFAKGSDT